MVWAILTFWNIPWKLDCPGGVFPDMLSLPVDIPVTSVPSSTNRQTGSGQTWKVPAESASARSARGVQVEYNEQ